MRSLIVIAGLILATGAFAEDKPKPIKVTKPVDKSTPVLMTTDGSSDSAQATDAKEMHNRSKSRAQDYNSSRSNIRARSRSHAQQGDLDGDGRQDAACRDGVDNDCDGVASAAPANHNSTRSNRSRAQDYNSSRSNKSSGKIDTDDDGDSVLEEVRCSMASDACIDPGDGSDRVVRKKPGKR